MVEACAGRVACVKPQVAFFERHGPEGRMQNFSGKAGEQQDKMDLQAGEVTKAVENFDQLGEQQDESAQNSTGMPQSNGTRGKTYMMLVEQQLNAIEGDPVQLLHNRFQLEEQQRLQEHSPGVRIYEPRPW